MAEARKMPERGAVRFHGGLIAGIKIALGSKAPSSKSSIWHRQQEACARVVQATACALCHGGMVYRNGGR